MRLTHQFETDDPCGLARRLIAEGKAGRGDHLETLRDGKVCLVGSIGWFADHAVKENAIISPRFIRWKPFPDARRQALAAKNVLEVE